MVVGMVAAGGAVVKAVPIRQQKGHSAQSNRHLAHGNMHHWSQDFTNLTMDSASPLECTLHIAFLGICSARLTISSAV